MQFHPIFGKRQKGDVVLEGGQDIWHYFRLEYMVKSDERNNETFSPKIKLVGKCFQKWKHF